MVEPPSFDPYAFCVSLGSQLVTELAEAGSATTPGMIGAARENRIRNKLEQTLPRNVAVGSGCVIDSYGGTSRQQDVVVYERDLCPVFSVGDLPESSYYPCEGVVAVGEVKSTLDRTQLVDALRKVRSVRRLERRALASEGLVGSSVPFRDYGSRLSIHGSPAESFDQAGKYTDRTFGFVVFRTLGVAPQRLADEIADAAAEHGADALPTILVGIEDGILVFSTPDGQWTLDVTAESAAVFLRAPSPFVTLIQTLRSFIRLGRTAEIGAFDYYFHLDDEQRGDVEAHRPLS